MKRKKNNGNTTFLIAIIIFTISIVILLGYLIFNNDTSIETENNFNYVDTGNNIDDEKKDKDKNQNNNKNNTGSDQVFTSKKESNSYKVDDTIILKNNTIWNVIKNSPANDNFVTILSDDNINENNSISYKSAANYISTTYKSKIEKAFKTNSSDIKEVRLLSINDISALSGISADQLVPGKSIANNKTPSFLYDSETITSSISNGMPLMICSVVSESENNDPGKMCLGSNSEYFPIRIVMTINKKFIK